MRPKPDDKNGVVSNALWLRILSTIVAIPLVLGAVFADKSIFITLVGVCALVMAMEWIGLCRTWTMRSGKDQKTHQSHSDPARAFQASAALLVAVVLGAMILAYGGYVGVGLALAGLPLLSTAIVERGRNWRLAVGAPYILVPCVSLIWIHGHPDIGAQCVTWVLVTVWATDMGAYVAGRLIGGARLAPRISPHKTWSGLAGGMGFAMGAAVPLAHVLTLPPPLWSLVLGAGVMAVVAQGGDLLESAIKRRCKVKDSGWIMPGHGGILDRVDGLLAVVPLVALVLLVGGHTG